MHVAALYRYSTRRNTQERSERARELQDAARGTFTVASLPEALPCHHFDARFPQGADVWGNILLRDETELREWVRYCRPSSREEAEKNGGCVIFQPATSRSEAAASTGAPRYYCITATDDTVYGRAAYFSESVSAITDRAEVANAVPREAPQQQSSNGS
ncbi:hypothetical protein ABB37_09105 [Leptomonas pyrrhocoris]|uniref:Uncharacterized protein n=1 Tax=Leptomonas pyrrhocoris TaxID=157538 RepID=A0A0N0VD58_LEPPY|nr:hypothetical protein ABB37_09105 [Leptomonas pyrrhocoris]KPA74401.1 hypothetical protein ABB37_09105 [Leptomonas pyrrhocoris]|eukprot:XP_015652840.1 hypothetical protein ABB37_09105 [Leptomonas pyrrhocoris]